MSIGNIPNEDEEDIRQRQRQPYQGEEQIPRGPTITQRLAQGAKNRLLNFHYQMIARKRYNAQMKQQNPKKYTKMVVERKERYNIMNTPNLFSGEGQGSMKW